MTELITFAVSLLSLLVAWRLALRKSIQDAYKDKLFDVRDEVRRRFKEKGQLDSAAYKNLRDTLNCYIRFIEVASFSRTFVFSAQIKKNPALVKQVAERLALHFVTPDKELTAFARQTRQRCCRLIHDYVFHSSFYSIALLYFIALPLVLAKMAVACAKREASASFGKVWSKIRRTVTAREDDTINPQHTEMLSQIVGGHEGLCLA